MDEAYLSLSNLGRSHLNLASDNILNSGGRELYRGMSFVKRKLFRNGGCMRGWNSAVPVERARVNVIAVSDSLNLNVWRGVCEIHFLSSEREKHSRLSHKGCNCARVRLSEYDEEDEAFRADTG